MSFLSPFLAYKSYLWTSASMVDKYDYAQKIGAHVTVLDLEDSVLPEQKDEARCAVIAYLESKPHHVCGVRINSLRTSFGIRDLDALINSAAQPDVILLPKVESAEEIVIANQLLSPRLKNLVLGAIIESSAGLRVIDEIATVGNNLQLLFYGPADFSADIGVSVDWEGFDYVRYQIILAAARAGIFAIDTADFTISNLEKLQLTCRRAKNLGFIGKVAIHPSQVAIINQEFAPTAEEISQAKDIVTKSEQMQSSIFVIDGTMYGPPMLKIAQQILASVTSTTSNAIAKVELQSGS